MSVNDDSVPDVASAMPARKSTEAASSKAYDRCSVSSTPIDPTRRVRRLRAIGSGPG